MSLLVITGVAMVFLLMIYVYYMSRNHGLLRKLGIPGPSPTLVFGNFLEEARAGIIQYHMKLYNAYQGHKVYGYIRGKTPFIVIRDLDMVKDITVKYFNNFPNRNSFISDEPVNHALTELKDDHWKNVRTTVSPTFNAKRLKRMCEHFQRNTRTLLDHFQTLSEANRPVELRDICSNFAMDNIASSGFGVQTNSVQNPDNDFARESRRTLSNIGLMIMGTAFFGFIIPLLKRLGISFMPKTSITYFKHFVDEALRVRRENSDLKKSPNDFLQLLLESEADESEVDDNRTEDEATAIGEVQHKRPLTHIDIQGQAFVFILAGFETASTALSFQLFLLAMNKDCLKTAQEEIDYVLGGEFPDYDNVQNLKYLDMCINESMRLYSPGFLVDRTCNTDCEIQGIKFTKEVSVMIPICAIHRDPAHWPDPVNFDPSRFSADAKASRHPYAFMPFGHGPRNCIGQRLAMLELRVALAAILQKFDLVTCDKTVYPVEFEPFRMAAKEGLWIKFECRK